MYPKSHAYKEVSMFVQLSAALRKEQRLFNVEFCAIYSARGFPSLTVSSLNKNVIRCGIVLHQPNIRIFFILKQGMLLVE